MLVKFYHGVSGLFYRLPNLTQFTPELPRLLTPINFWVKPNPGFCQRGLLKRPLSY